MSKVNDTSKLGHAKLQNRMLADSELDAVSGGVTIKQKVVDSPPPG